MYEDRKFCLRSSSAGHSIWFRLKVILPGVWKRFINVLCLGLSPPGWRTNKVFHSLQRPTSDFSEVWFEKRRRSSHIICTLPSEPQGNLGCEFFGLCPNEGLPPFLSSGIIAHKLLSKRHGVVQKEQDCTSQLNYTPSIDSLLCARRGNM
jgi:hypothetical protein